MKNPDSAIEMKINKDLIEGLRKLKAAAGVETKGTSLGVHPGYSANASFAQAAKNLILSSASERNFFATSVQR